MPRDPVSLQDEHTSGCDPHRLVQPVKSPQGGVK